MTLKISKHILRNFLILLPFLLVYSGSVLSALNPSLSTAFKIGAFLYMAIYVFVNLKVPQSLTIALLLFLPFLVYNVYISFNIKAGISDGIRYLFPVVTLFYGYSIRKHLNLLVGFVVFFVVSNFFFQFINYFYWLRGEEQWFYFKLDNGTSYYNSISGILRATGYVVFFGFYGFANMIAYFFLKKYYTSRYKKIILLMAIFSFFASLSYKAIAVFLVILLIYYRKNILGVLLGIVAGALGLYAMYPEKINIFIENFWLRIRLYIVEGGSARSESYRVMFKEIGNGNWFGKGVGLFGGPASTTYNSPYYEQVHFNWYDAAWMNLPTTDTYPPHVFVELGIIGGLLYFLLLTTPILKRKVSALVLIIYFSLYVDMLFTFSMNNLEYLLFSLVLIYPIYYYDKQQKTA